VSGERQKRRGAFSPFVLRIIDDAGDG